MKTFVIIITTLLLVFSLSLSEETKPLSSGNEEVQERVPQTIEEAFELSQPVVTLFYTTKGCKCTNTRCKEVKDRYNEFTKGFGNTYTFMTIDISKFKGMSKTYKIFALPVLLVFDKDGKELFRINHPEITEENLLEQLSVLDKAGEAPGSGEKREGE